VDKLSLIVERGNKEVTHGEYQGSEHKNQRKRPAKGPFMADYVF
jgi:hypothetical protein